MYGYAADNNKLRKSTRDKIPGFFRARRYGAFRRSGVPAFRWATGEQGQGNRGRGTGAGEQGQGNRNRATGTAYIHALCGNCKENLAKTRLKTEISRYLRKILLKNLHKAKICRTFALSKEKPIKAMKMNEKEILKNFVKAVKAENGEMPDEICIRAYFQNIHFCSYLYLRIDYKGDVVGMWTRNEDGKIIKKASISEVLNTIWEFYKDDFKEVETVDPEWFFE